MVYGIIDQSGRGRVTSTYNEVVPLSVHAWSHIVSIVTSSSSVPYSFKSSNLFYGTLFVLSGFLLTIILLLLVLCLLQHRKLRLMKEMDSSHTFPYLHKELKKSSSLTGNDKNTLQIPGERSQHHVSDVGLGRYESNNGSIGRDRRRTQESFSQIPGTLRSGSMKTINISPDLYTQRIPGTQLPGPQLHNSEYQHQQYYLMTETNNNEEEHESRYRVKVMHQSVDVPGYESFMGFYNEEDTLDGVLSPHLMMMTSMDQCYGSPNKSNECHSSERGLSPESFYQHSPSHPLYPRYCNVAGTQYVYIPSSLDSGMITSPQYDLPEEPLHMCNNDLFLQYQVGLENVTKNQDLESQVFDHPRTAYTMEDHLPQVQPNAALEEDLSSRSHMIYQDPVSIQSTTTRDDQVQPHLQYLTDYKLNLHKTLEATPDLHWTWIEGHPGIYSLHPHLQAPVIHDSVYYNIDSIPLSNNHPGSSLFTKYMSRSQEDQSYDTQC